MTTSSNPTQIKRVLFICSANSVRSQMAEGFLRQLYPEKYDGYSAGIQSSYVHPKAHRTMAEIGIDLTHHTSNAVDEYLKDDFDVAIILCEHASKVCPPIPNTKEVLHWPTPDPTNFPGPLSEAENYMRNIRDGLGQKIKNHFK